MGGVSSGDSDVVLKGNCPTSCASWEVHFRRILLTAARNHIPTDYARDRPNRLTDEARDLARVRDRL